MGVLAKTDMKSIYFKSLRLLIFHLAAHYKSQAQYEQKAARSKPNSQSSTYPNSSPQCPRLNKTASPTLTIFQGKNLSVILGSRIFSVLPINPFSSSSRIIQMSDYCSSLLLLSACFKPLTSYLIAMASYLVSLFCPSRKQDILNIAPMSVIFKVQT